MSRKIRYGIGRGGRGAFIGAVHRIARRGSANSTWFAAAFSSDPESARSERHGFFFCHRIVAYGTFEEMSHHTRFQTRVSEANFMDF